MNSRERILAAVRGAPADRAPLTTWCFGLTAPAHLRWERDGRTVAHWYSKRMEHLHTLPEPWTLEDDFERVRTWLRLGLDDLLDVSVPWSQGPEVTWRDSKRSAGDGEPYPRLVRDYQTPAGALRHVVRQTGESAGPGWVVQPKQVPIIEDFNVPRGVKHLVESPAEVEAMAYLFRPPDVAAQAWFAKRLARVREFVRETPVAVQAWSAFGMDAAVWFCGAQGAVLLAVEEPAAFERLMDLIAVTDRARTELAATTAGVDLVVQRGWYSSTDFWSPRLFDRYVVPHLRQLTALAHAHGKAFGYVMTTGVELLGPKLAEAGVDVLYFVDPVQDRIALERARDLLGGRMTLVGGTSALSLASGDPARIRAEVRRAVEVLGPTRRFILHPVDALFPDTPWAGVESMIEAWRTAR